MLRRSVLALLLCLFAAGLGLAGEAAAAMQGEVCAQHGSMPGDCGDGMAGNACTVHCAAGACVVPAFAAPQLTMAAVRPVAREGLRLTDGRYPPDTAPPKPSFS